MRSSFAHNEPDGGTSTDEFNLDSVRLYVNGSVTDNIKVMFNTDYDSATNKIGVLDAVGRFDMSPKFNIWFGRFLPPSDRANLYGPFYAHDWASIPTAFRTAIPLSFKAATTASRTGATSARSKISVGAFDGRFRRPATPKSSEPPASRLISGIRRAATT